MIQGFNKGGRRIASDRACSTRRSASARCRRAARRTGRAAPSRRLFLLHLPRARSAARGRSWEGRARTRRGTRVVALPAARRASRRRRRPLPPNAWRAAARVVVRRGLARAGGLPSSPLAPLVRRLRASRVQRGSCWSQCWLGRSAAQRHSHTTAIQPSGSSRRPDRISLEMPRGLVTECHQPADLAFEAQH